MKIIWYTIPLLKVIKILPWIGGGWSLKRNTHQPLPISEQRPPRTPGYKVPTACD